MSCLGVSLSRYKRGLGMDGQDGLRANVHRELLPGTGKGARACAGPLRRDTRPAAGPAPAAARPAAAAPVVKRHKRKAKMTRYITITIAR